MKPQANFPFAQGQAQKRRRSRRKAMVRTVVFPEHNRPMSYKSIANELGVSVGEVKRIEARACAKLAPILETADEFEKLLFGLELEEHLSTPKLYQFKIQKTAREKLLIRFGLRNTG